SVVVVDVVVVDVSVPVAASVDVVLVVDSSFVVWQAARESEATTKAAAEMVRSVAFIGTSVVLGERRPAHAGPAGIAPCCGACVLARSGRGRCCLAARTRTSLHLAARGEIGLVFVLRQLAVGVGVSLDERLRQALHRRRFAHAERTVLVHVELGPILLLRRGRGGRR